MGGGFWETDAPKDPVARKEQQMKQQPVGTQINQLMNAVQNIAGKIRNLETRMVHLENGFKKVLEVKKPKVVEDADKSDVGTD